MARGLFSIPNRPDKETEINLAKSANSTAKAPTARKSSGGLAERISRARSLIEKNLGENNYRMIRSKEELEEFIDKVNYERVVSIDTETTGLDPMIDKIVGISLSVENDDVYIPINHVSYITHERTDNQLTEEEVRECLSRILPYVFIVMFNAPFDIRVIWNQVGIRLWCNWDCSIASRIMNENEPRDKRGLKALYQKYCEKNDHQALKFSDLFEGIRFDEVPINLGYIYAANDSRITLKLYEFQKQYIYYEGDCDYSDRNGMNGASWVFFNIEMPCVDVVVDMENQGVLFDKDYNEQLKTKYHTKLKESLQQVYDTLEVYKEEIRRYKASNPGVKLDEPINLDSPKQVGIVLYDIMKVKPIEGEPERGTGEAILKKINNDFTNAMLDYRGLTKLVDTYIDKLPKCVNPNDGRIHCKFNQYGADTGRFSSNDPNLQNIPSHTNDIRKVFVASEGYVLLSSDYSQQEPSCLASLCNDLGYPTLYNARKEGDDIYSHVASACFNVPYEQCCEFDSQGNKNPKEYKERRNMAKPVLLGILYGRGDPSVAEGMGITLEEAKRLKANLYRKYPEIKIFEDESIKMAEELGYVTTVCGRKRRLPSMMLPDYEVRWKDGVAPDNDPLSFDGEVETEVPEAIQRKWLTKVKRASYKRKVFEEANKEGLWIVDNTKNKDVTKVVNARIQGSAADLTKLAMIDLRNSEELKALGFRMLIPVHDEIIAECPLENAKECAKLLAEIMSNAAQKILKMPFNCDVEISREWYGDTIKL